MLFILHHFDSHYWGDYLRLLTIGLGFFLDGIIIAIVLVASRFSAPPKYVYLISISYILLEGGVQERIYVRLGHTFMYRPTLFGLAANLFSLVAFMVMYNWYKPVNRQKRHQQRTQSIVDAWLKERDKDE